MSITECELDEVALVRNTVTYTYELKSLSVTLADTYNHVVYKRTIKTVEGILLLVVYWAVLVNLECNLTIFNLYFDRGVNLL